MIDPENVQWKCSTKTAGIYLRDQVVITYFIQLSDLNITLYPLKPYALLTAIYC